MKLAALSGSSAAVAWGARQTSVWLSRSTRSANDRFATWARTTKLAQLSGSPGAILRRPTAVDRRQRISDDWLSNAVALPSRAISAVGYWLYDVISWPFRAIVDVFSWLFSGARALFVLLLSPAILLWAWFQLAIPAMRWIAQHAPPSTEKVEMCLIGRDGRPAVIDGGRLLMSGNSSFESRYLAICGSSPATTVPDPEATSANCFYDMNSQPVLVVRRKIIRPGDSDFDRDWQKHCH